MDNKLAQSFIKEALEYDPNTGIFIWKKRPTSHFKDIRTFNCWNARYPGTQAGSIRPTGYRAICINSKRYLSHRLVFLYIEGYLPENDVDHIDRDKINNKWINLREVSNQCNAQNCKLSNKNTSGVTGVTFIKAKNKWYSQIMVSGKTIYLGLFEKFEDAVIARYEEEKRNPLWSCSIKSSAKEYLLRNGLYKY